MTVKNNSAKRKYENTMPVTDEGWWESVLAEERLHAPTRPPQMAAAKPKPAVEEKVDQAQPVEPVNVNWDEIKELYAADRIITMKVTGHNRGGLLVEADAVSGFVPFSHLIELAGKDDEDRDQSLESYVGKSLSLKVIECVPEDGRVVFSQRAALAEPGKRSQLFHSLEAGSQVSGTVTNITDFGVFVDLGGVEGLIHISELSWTKRPKHPSEIIKEGQEVEAIVLRIDSGERRLSLGLRQTQPDPWKTLPDRFPPGTPVKGKVTGLTDFGIFVEIEPGIEGLIHVSEIDYSRVEKPADLFKKGDEVEAVIINIDPVEQRISLSRKRLLPPPVPTALGEEGSEEDKNRRRASGDKRRGGKGRGPRPERGSGEPRRDRDFEGGGNYPSNFDPSAVAASNTSVKLGDLYGDLLSQLGLEEEKKG
jgi:predicted RNA-binding protein with RPS1 domain